ncbi:MAG: helix-turn-helix domain-containing protein, partial [Chitinivibrionales bacterium]|nr:helix-turn-helix domain-containing protein [Chitinivibrionales bacterium]
DRPIKEIASSVGLPDYAYFQRAFKKVHGLPPGALRRRSAAP